MDSISRALGIVLPDGSFDYFGGKIRREIGILCLSLPPIDGEKTPMKTPKVDARSPEQKQADESAAAGKWEGFETETLISEEGALQLLRHNHLSAAQNGVDSPAALGSVRLQPFRCRDKVYRLLLCYFRDG